jgi:hypothetical protein
MLIYQIEKLNHKPTNKTNIHVYKLIEIAIATKYKPIDVACTCV